MPSTTARATAPASRLRGSLAPRGMRLAVAARAYERARKTGLEASCHQGRSAGARAAFLGLLCGCTYLPCSAAFVACPSHNSKGSSNAGTKVSSAFLLALRWLLLWLAVLLPPLLQANSKKRKEGGKGTGGKVGGGAGGKEAGEQAARRRRSRRQSWWRSRRGTVTV